MPKVEAGLVEYSEDERFLMREHGLCVTCDFENTCQIRQGNVAVMRSWNGAGEHLKILVKYCSKHEVQGVKTFGIRGE